MEFDLNLLIWLAGIGGMFAGYGLRIVTETQTP
jgi:hypothetical protein